MDLKRKVATLAAILLTFALFAGEVNADTVIDTTSGLTGSFVAPFGEPDSATYGQTFTVETNDTVLDSFQFRLDDYVDVDPDFVDFEAYVYKWDGSKAEGSALFQSGPESTTNNGGLGGMELFTFNTGGVSLDQGDQYVAFLSSSNFFDRESGRSRWDLSVTDIYDGGNFVYLNNGSDFSELTATDWEQLRSGDTFFVANFTPVPEPSTIVILGLGSLGIMAARRKRATSLSIKKG